MVRFLAACAFSAALITCAAADDYGMAPAAVGSPGLWRGHFSGGINYDPYARNIALAWNDQVAFFPDNVACRRWIRDMRAQWKTYEGPHGCLRIR